MSTSWFALTRADAPACFAAPGAAWLPRTRKRLDQLLNEACQRWVVTHGTLRSSSRQRRLICTRVWIAHQAITESVKLHFKYPDHPQPRTRDPAKSIKRSLSFDQ